MGVGEDYGIDIAGADAGDFEARLNGSGGAGILAGAGIDEDDAAASFDEQAGIGAEDGFGRLAAALEGELEFLRIGVGKEPGDRVGIVAIGEHGATDGADLEAMRTLWHIVEKYIKSE
jgi:hypothetical protein